jgi:1,4-dihydroxy-2-naphthoate octaprenyltransferase
MQTQIRTGRDPLLPPARTPGAWLVWWRLARPHTLTASFVPVAIGTAFALPHGPTRLPVFLAMLLASLLIQAATNMFNEYFDYRRGLDNVHSVGISGTIVHDGFAPRTVLAAALITTAAAFFLGLYLCFATGWELLPVGFALASVGYFYSGGPCPLSATPLGEIASGLCMGLGIIAVAFYVQTGFISPQALLVSVPTSVLIGAILMANNIRDLDGDALHGRRTLAILLGRGRAILALAAMFALAGLWLVGLVIAGVAGPWALLALAAIPKAARAVRGFTRGATPAELMPAMVATAQTNTVFGLLLALGLLVQHLAAR